MPAKSAGWPLRPIMVLAASAAERTGSRATGVVIAVGTKPGAIALQRTPDAAQASACDLVSDTRPPLAAPYPPLLPNARMACCDATLMMRPQPWAAIAGPNSWPSRNGAVRLTSSVRSHSAWASWASGGLMFTPAALTRMSGSPNILVNAAGVNIRPPLAQLAQAEWDRTLEVNLTAPFLLGQEFGPAMAAQGWGRIINVASQQAIRAFGNSGGYGAAKGGLVSLTRSQAEAWAASGVRCNAIAPGFVPTAMTTPVARDPVRSAALAARTMIGRNGQPADFAGITVFLASAASDYVTGQLICVDGGFSAT